MAGAIIAGCGGGGDDNSPSTATAVQLQAPTTPEAPGANGSTPNTETRPPTTSTSPTPDSNGATPDGVESFQRSLVPFRNCLQRHGVDPGQFQQSFRQGAQARRSQPLDPAQVRKQIQAGIACIPALPPALQAGAKRLARRYEQRAG
jgi:hypothetical protein